MGEGEKKRGVGCVTGKWTGKRREQEEKGCNGGGPAKRGGEDGCGRPRASKLAFVDGGDLFMWNG